MRKKVNIYNALPIVLALTSTNINAQVKISNYTGTINSESILHLESSENNKGLLLTRVALQSINLSNPLSSHVDGIVVYNTETAGTTPNNVTPGLYYNNGNSWIKLSTKTPKTGDIKNGFQTADHNGWYLLNGRDISTLSTHPKARAASLGFSTNLPDVTDRYLKNTNGTDNIGALAGVDNFILTQANLPNINFSGTTNTTGSHTHNYTDNPVNSSNNNIISGTNNPVSNTNSINDVTSTAGAHTHTLSVSLGGNDQPISLKPNNIITNLFIYLGN